MKSLFPDGDLDNLTRNMIMSAIHTNQYNEAVKAKFTEERRKQHK
jgi:hypothetical protein